MVRAAITLLLGLSSFTAAYASAATCEGYLCPDGWHARQDLKNLQCQGSTCSAKDVGTCCLKGPAPAPTPPPDASPCDKVNPGSACDKVTPVTPAPTPKPDGSPCDKVTVKPTPAPTPPPVTAPPATCSTYTCPTGWTPKANGQLIRCWKASGCTAQDTPNCCVKATTPVPTPAPTLAPTPSPPIVPGSCKVRVPRDGFAPWEVYKVMKASTPKIDTPDKMLMGGETMNITGVTNIRASQFHCQYANREMRAVLDTQRSSPVVTVSLHDALTPSVVTTQCLLSAISMYKSPNTGIPGLRFDYADCPFGVAKQATILVGLRKVPDNWGATPKLGDFFKDVCPAHGGKPTGDAQLRFDLNDILTAGVGCFANSVDYTLMTSQNDCFEPALVFTFMDANNHFTLFPVTDAEWTYLQNKIPKPAPTLHGVASVGGASPCDPVTPTTPHVYGHILQNRLCVAMPELGCHNYCGKTCQPIIVYTGTTTTTPACSTCYDCEFDEIWYAFWCTLLAFILAQTFHKIWTRGTWSMQWYWSDIQIPEQPYSMLRQPARAISRETFTSAVIGFFFFSLFWTLVAFALVNFLDYIWHAHFVKKEMCLKIIAWQDFNVGAGMWWHGGGYACHNLVCFWRLIGLFVTVWLSIWGLFIYWRYYLSVTAEKHEIKRIEAKVEMGASGGAGAFAYGGAYPVACTVQ